MECVNLTTAVTNCTSPAVPSEGSDIALHVLFGVIASLAFISNGVLILIVLRNKSMLKSSYNVLILCLAVTDMLTGNVPYINNFNLTKRFVLSGYILGRSCYCRMLC